MACTEADLHEECREHTDCPDGLACSFEVCVDPTEVDVCGDPGLAFCDQRCVDSLSTLETCGGCGGCPELEGAEAVTCAQGRCTYACADGFTDTDDNADNGCDCTDPAGCDQRCEPTGDEICDGTDNDCNGRVDDVGAAADGALWVDACVVPDNTVVTGCAAAQCLFECAPGFVDLNDVEADGCECAATPEQCDGRDNDCNGIEDDVAAASPNEAWVESCDAPQGTEVIGCSDGACQLGCLEGYVDLNEDLGDGCECRFEAEICDGVDNDCNGMTDEDASACPEVTGALPTCRDATCAYLCDVASGSDADAFCDDGQFCNGPETCAPQSPQSDDRGCQSGAAPIIDDGIDCTDDHCDEDTDGPRHIANDALCDDGTFCNGAETCGEIGCEPGPPAPDVTARCQALVGCNEELEEWETIPIVLPGLACVPAGSFQMGTSAESLARWSEVDPDVGAAIQLGETPAHMVTLTRSILVSLHEETQAQWAATLESDPSTNQGCDECPVEAVNWFEALAYANARSESEGLERCYVLDGCSGGLGGGCGGDTLCDGDYLCSEVRFVGLDCPGWRLPTEAEWERFTRAGTQTETYAGDFFEPEVSGHLDPIAWYAGNTNESQMVGQLEPNSFGLFDTLGNVSEWTWSPLPDYTPPPVVDPIDEFPDGDLREVVVGFRGGDFVSRAAWVRSAARGGTWAHRREASVGIRLVRTVSP